MKLALRDNRSLDLRNDFHVMGILNCTPDSFYAGSRVDAAAVVDVAAAMITDGASLLDIGGESTRPGADYIPAAVELERIIPAIEAIRCRWPVALSVDTRKAEVARAAVAAGADIINDVAALTEDRDMAPLCAELGVPVVLMHKKGIPASMQDQPFYTDCLGEVLAWFKERISHAQNCGISSDTIILDPGIGFGKRLEDNLALLRGLPALAALGCPVLVGISRKSCIGQLTGQPVERRLSGSLAALVYARQQGAAIFRVHDVRESVDALRVFDALAKGGSVTDEHR